MARTFRQSLKKSFPKLHAIYVSGRARLTTEYKVLRRIGIRSILRGTLWRRSQWREQLPMQKPQQIDISGIQFTSIDELLMQLEGLSLAFSTGGNAVYLPPATIDATGFSILRKYYPSGTGLKLVRDPGGIKESRYTSGDNRSMINKKLTSNHGYLTLAMNLLFLKGLGPRLYDLVELSVGGQLWTAYIVQHVNGRVPTMNECKQGLKKIQDIEKTGVFQVTIPGGYEHKDFTCPGCNGNALMAEDGQFNYVDFQNFVLGSYDTFLRELANNASRDTHFGDESVLWGGRFLYQSVPGLQMPSRRNVDQRIVVIERFMENAGLSLEDRLVLDVGCNIGMVTAEYLKKGAKWCHGWDMPHIVQHSEKLLLASGCTRFSLTGGKIVSDQRLEDEIPDFVKPDLEGCVILYLAVRAHVGFLASLGRIPWSYLIYEGHQGDDFEADMTEFRKLVDFDIIESTMYSDGLTDERDVALLARKS